MRIKLLIVISVIYLTAVSCNKSQDYNRTIVGEWLLDSISLPNGKLIKPTYSETLDFQRSKDYEYGWWQGDVGHQQTGKYFILRNPNRINSTLVLISNLQLSGSDTIRNKYFIKDILRITKANLVLINDTEWINKDSIHTIPFNQRLIYTKQK